MAGVQVPRVQRIQPQATPSVGRANLEIPNMTANPQMEALSNIAENQVNYFQKQEDAAIDTAAKAAANEYAIYLNKELNTARQFQGDPTSVYATFDENRAKKYDELINKNPNISARGKSMIESALNETATGYQIKRDTAFSGQYYQYDSHVTDTSAKLAAQDMMSYTGYLDPQDPKSFKPIGGLIRKIENLYRAHGEKFGEVTKDEYGQYISTPNIDMKIAMTVSDGLVATISNLNDSGRPDLADAVYAEYGKYIDVTKKDNVLKETRKEKQLLEVLDAVNETEAMSADKLEVYLDKKFKNDLEGKEKAYEAIEARSRRVTNRQNRISDSNYNQAFDIVSSRMNGESPFGNVFEMENDPAIKKLMPLITKPSQKKALQQMVDSPSKSDMDVYNKNLDLSVNGGYAGMTTAQFNESIEGLNNSDRKRFENEFKKQKQDTESAQRTRSNDAWNKLYRKFENGGFIKKKDGKLTKSSQEFLARVQTKFLQSTDSYSKNMSPKDIDDLNNKIYDEEVKLKSSQPKGWMDTIREFWTGKSGNADEREIDRKPYFPSAPNSPLAPNSSKSVPKSAAPPATDATTGQVTAPKGKRSIKVIQDAQVAFQKEKGRPPTSAELKNYMTEKGL